MAIKTYSPLRYPGGKNKLTSYVTKLINTNNLNGCTYIEPYTGGGAVALNLLFNGIANQIVINDYDRSIYAFWYCVLYRTEDLCNLIINTEITIENWHIQKAIQKNKDNEELLTLGFSTLFLNRTNRSGIIKAGVIGGLKQSGNYKLDCRFKKDDIISKIRHISTFREHIQLYNLDTLDLIKNVIPEIQGNKFIFFDPPYYNKGATLYVNFYKHDDHLELQQCISNINDCYWIVTYDNEEEIREIYSEYRNCVYSLNYTAAEKRLGHEVMFYSDNLIINDACKEVI